MNYSNPNQDDRIMAALSHITAILPITGIFISGAIWVTHKEKSTYVKIQAIQALTFQLLNLLIWIIGFACHFLMFFATFLLTIAAIPLTFLLPENLYELSFIISLLPIFFPFSILIFLLFLGLFYIIYAITAAYNCLQGNSFKYWIIGNRIEKYLQQE